MKNKRCYYCDNLAINREHVPPKCLFDTQSQNLNLIVVPSCEEHNTNKSHLDEKIFFAIRTTAKLSENHFNRLIKTSQNNKNYIKDINHKQIIPIIGVKKLSYVINQMIHKGNILFQPIYQGINKADYIKYFKMMSSALFFHSKKIRLLDKYNNFSCLIITNINTTSNPNLIEYFSSVSDIIKSSNELGFILSKDKLIKISDEFSYGINEISTSSLIVQMEFFDSLLVLVGFTNIEVIEEKIILNFSEI